MGKPSYDWYGKILWVTAGWTNATAKISYIPVANRLPLSNKRYTFFVQLCSPKSPWAQQCVNWEASTRLFAILRSSPVLLLLGPLSYSWWHPWHYHCHQYWVLEESAWEGVPSDRCRSSTSALSLMWTMQGRTCKDMICKWNFKRVSKKENRRCSRGSLGGETAAHAGLSGTIKLLPPLDFEQGTGVGQICLLPWAAGASLEQWCYYQMHLNGPA